MPTKDTVIANKVFIGLPWKNVKPKYEHCIDKLRGTSPLYWHIVGRDDSQSAEDLLQRIKLELDSASNAIFDATGGNPNVSLEYGYAEAKGIERALYLSDHKTSSKSSTTGTPIISDLAGKKQNRYKNEKRLFALLKAFSAKHPFTIRYEKAMSVLCKGKKGPQARSIRSLALRVIHFLDGVEFKRRIDLVDHLKAEGVAEDRIGKMIKSLHSHELILSKQGPHSTVRIR